MYVSLQTSESREFISCYIYHTISAITRVKVQIAVASQTHLKWMEPISFKDEWEEWEPHAMSMFTVYITTHASVPGTAERDVTAVQVSLSTNTKILLTWKKHSIISLGSFWVSGVCICSSPNRRGVDNLIVAGSHKVHPIHQKTEFSSFLLQTVTSSALLQFSLKW